MFEHSKTTYKSTKYYFVINDKRDRFMFLVLESNYLKIKLKLKWKIRNTINTSLQIDRPCCAIFSERKRLGHVLPWTSADFHLQPTHSETINWYDISTKDSLLRLICSLSRVISIFTVAITWKFDTTLTDFRNLNRDQLTLRWRQIYILIVWIKPIKAFYIISTSHLFYKI